MEQVSRMNLSGGAAPKQPLVLNPEKLAEVQGRTYVEMVNSLMLYGECNLERPTGFGKTKLFMQFAKEHPSEPMIYVYDMNTVVDDIKKKYRPKNIVFISYALLSRLAARQDVVQEIVGNNWFAIIFDESHLMGGENVGGTIAALLPKLKQKGCRVLGGTATPIRTDGRNVTAEFFGGHTVSEYTISDAIDDGIMLEPMMVLMLGVQQRIDKLRNESRENRYAVDRLNQLEHVYADRIGAPKIYRSEITKLFGGNLPSYMRFIAYYPTIKAMKDNAEKLQADFIKAFPKYGVGLTLVSSDAEHEKAVSHLDEAIVDDTIDIIASVDMLNQAYHSQYLTGVIMMRYTMSNIVYAQQYGRACSVASKQRTIVFDNVGNACLDPQRELTVLLGDGESDGRGGWYWVEKIVGI